MNIRHITATAIVALVAAADAHAQQVEEIVVTAQRRSENLQSVPIAVSAVTASAAESAGIRTSNDLAIAVPGLNVTRTTSATNFTLRGIGTQGGATGQDSAIALFVDGVYMPSMAGSTLALNNIERIEVLKGPQGTLYGRNATGGAVNIITKDPSHNFGLQAEMGYGNLHTMEGSFYATGGLTDTVAMDVAAYYKNQGDGFGTNTTLGTDVNKQRDFAVRSKLKFEPTDNLKFTIAGDYSYTGGSIGIAYRAVPTSNLLTGQVGYSGGYYDSQSEFEPNLHTRTFGGLGKIEYTFGDFKLTSISAYRGLNGFQRVDVDATALKIIDAPLYSKDRQFTQEVQLAYTSGKLNAIFGLYYLDSSNVYDPFQIVSQVLFGPGLTGRQVLNTKQKTQSYAAFGQATYEIFDRTNLTLGLRYTEDKRHLTGTGFTEVSGAVIPGSNASYDQQKSFGKPSWRLALDHKLTSTVMLYTSYSRGFKSGVYNLTSPSDPVVKPETLDAWEAGIKSDLFDRRIRLNASGFYYKYNNIQLSQVNGSTTTLFNAAKAEVYGFDLDGTAAITDQLSFSGGLEYLHDRYKSFPSAVITSVSPIPGAGNIIVAGSAKGNRLVNVPDWTLNGSLNYRIPVGRAKIDANLSAAYNDGFYWAVDNRLRQKAFTVVNAQIMWTAPGGQWNIKAFGKNLFQKHYLLSLNENNTGDEAVPAMGRTYGATVGVKF